MDESSGQFNGHYPGIMLLLSVTFI